MNSVASIYIPRIRVYYTESEIESMLDNLGVISRIDFTPVNKKPGFHEEFGNTFMSIFVHFSKVYTHAYARIFWDTIREEIPFRISFDGTDEYLICLQNKKPVPFTMMNIDQVVDNARYLEEKVMKQADRIEELEKRLNMLEKGFGLYI